MSFQKGNPGVFDQHIWDISATRKHPIGTLRDLGDGRVFAYAKAGGTALAAGTLTAKDVQVANHLNLDVAAAPTSDSGAIGSVFITVTLGATAATLDQYADGYIYHNKNGVLGQQYKIKGHPAADASATLKVELYDPLRVAAADADEFTLVTHSQSAVVICPTTVVSPPTGVPQVAVTAANYFWNQVKGPCAILADGTLIIGVHVRTSDGTAGSVEALDRDGTAEDDINVGVCINIGTTAETAFITLAVPGY
jgi:hypothetical protein